MLLGYGLARPANLAMLTGPARHGFRPIGPCLDRRAGMMPGGARHAAVFGPGLARWPTIGIHRHQWTRTCITSPLFSSRNLEFGATVAHSFLFDK